MAEEVTAVTSIEDLGREKQLEKALPGYKELAAQPDPHPEAEKAHYELVRLLLASGDYQEAVYQATQFIHRHEESHLLAEVLYLRGITYQEMNKPTLAGHDFYAILLNHPTSMFASQSQVKLGDCPLQEGDAGKAKEQYLILIKNDIYKDQMAGIKYKLALCLKRLKKNEQAKDILAEVKAGNESSFYGVLAQQQLNLLNAQTSIKPSEALPASAPTPTTQPIEITRRYAVQVGAFKHKRNALQLKRNLEAKGYKPFVEEVEQNNRKLHMVRFGYYEDIEEARHMIDELQKKENIFSFLVTL